MADRTIETEVTEVPEINELLESLMLQTIEEAQAKLTEDKELAPFTAVVIGKSVFEESYAGETDECFAAAQDTVIGMENAVAYGFCYDGYLESDNGDISCIICEGGLPGEDAGIALALIYTEGEEITFEEDVIYLGEAPNFLAEAEPVEFVREDYAEVSDEEDTDEITE